MANEPYTRTNQKMYFASLALTQWRTAESVDSIESAGKVQAARESAIFHLHGAAVALCYEICSFYRLDADFESLTSDQLSKLTAETLKVSPELNELLLLINQPENWLSQLVLAYRQIQSPALNLSAASFHSHAEIEHIRNELKSLILRCRETLTEW